MLGEFLVDSILPVQADWLGLFVPVFVYKRISVEVQIAVEEQIAVE